MKTLPLLTELTGVSAFSTCAGFNICTYAGGDRSMAEADLRQLERLTGIDRTHMRFPVQTHTAEVRLADRPLDGVDGVVCTSPGMLIGVHTADCLPLLMADVTAGVIAAVHCGWRGTAAGIAANAVELMVSAGADTRHIVAAMGPCICADCFEVGEEVACRFPDEAVIRRPGAKPHVDLARAVALQLEAAGIRAITPPPACSMTDSRFYSVRRQGRSMTLRTLSAIALSL